MSRKVENPDPPNTPTGGAVLIPACLLRHGGRAAHDDLTGDFFAPLFESVPDLEPFFLSLAAVDFSDFDESPDDPESDLDSVLLESELEPLESALIRTRSR